MVFTILISIVFIAEIIIATAIISKLIGLDKKVLELDETLNLIKPSLREICNLVKGISEQVREFAYDFEKRVKRDAEDFAVKYLLKLFTAILLLGFNKKLINKFRRSKLVKMVGRGLSLLQIVV